MSEHLTYENMISGMVTRMASTRDTDAAMAAALQDVGRCTGASRVFLHVFHIAGTDICGTREWCAPGVAPQTRTIENTAAALSPSWLKHLWENQIIDIDHSKKPADESGVEQELLERLHAQTMRVLSVFADGEPLGFMGLEHGLELPELTSAQRDLLKAAADITGQALKINTLRKTLEDAEIRMQRLSENIPLGLFRWSFKNGLEFVSPRCLIITGYSMEEFMADPLLAFNIAMKYNPNLFESTSAAALGGMLPQRLDLTFQHKNGQIIILEVHTAAVRDAEGNLAAYEGAFTDITERKRLDEERANLTAQLTHSQKMEAIGTMAGGMAHDFNNMLTIIDAHAQILARRTGREHPDYEIIAPILEACTRAQDLTSKMLTFASKKRIQVETVSMNRIINSLVGMMQRSFPKNITLDIRLEENLPLVAADVDQMQQALLNICTNARDAMPEGGDLVIETKCMHYDEEWSGMMPGSYCLVRITDQGIGIPASLQQKIFEPFFTTKGSGKGTGLGLSLTYGIIKNHSGHIELRSESGKGTVFSIFLPMIQVPTESVAESGEDELKTGCGTILVVDDEPAVLRTIQMSLMSVGYHPIPATSGKEALELFEKHRHEIDLVLLDMIMPEMDGREVFRTLRKIAPDLDVLLVSGYSMENHASQLLREGARGFVSKPFKINELCNTIYDILMSKAALNAEKMDA